MVRPACFLCFAMFLALPSCEPRPKPTPRIWVINPKDLVASYRDFSDGWTGQYVRIGLGPKEYDVMPDTIRWCPDRKGSSPCILFECNPPRDNSRSIVIDGLCTGCTRDNSGVIVQVKQCSLTQR